MLAVVDDAGRYGPQVEVGHHVAADDHGAPLAAEHVHYPLQGIRPAVHVVAVELYGIASASRMAYTGVPAAADAQAGLLRDKVNHPAVGRGQFIYPFRCSVGGMIVYHYDIERKIRLLRECRAERVLNRGRTVEHRDDDRSLDDIDSAVLSDRPRPLRQPRPYFP